MEIIKPPGASSSPVAFRPMRCFDSEVVSLPLGTSRCWPVWLRKGRRWTIWRRLARNSDQAYLGVVNIYKIQKNEWNREIDDQFCTKPAESFKLGAHWYRQKNRLKMATTRANYNAILESSAGERVILEKVKALYLKETRIPVR